MQASNTGDMLFTIPQFVSFISRRMTLLPGDVIATCIRQLKELFFQRQGVEAR